MESTAYDAHSKPPLCQRQTGQMTVTMDTSGHQTGFAADALLEPEHIEFRTHFRRFVSERLEPLAMRGERERQFPREVSTRHLQKVDSFLRPTIQKSSAAAAGHSARLRVLRGTHTHSGGRVCWRVRTPASRRATALQSWQRRTATRADLPAGAPRPQTRIGAFALTEPDAGSDAQGIKTRARRDGDDWIISGKQGLHHQWHHCRLLHSCGAHLTRTQA